MQTVGRTVLQRAPRSVADAARHGLRGRCPACGRGAVLHRYLKVRPNCASCGEALGQIRADDFPPYLTIFIVGHLVVPLVLLAERSFAPPLWLQMTFWPALTAALTLLLLPYVKGAVIGVLWALRLRGDEHQ